MVPAMGRSKGHIPIRTCVSCGSKKAKHDLIRLLPDEKGILTIDSKGDRHGRAVYSCKNTECLESLAGNRRLARLLRTSVEITVDKNRILLSN